MSCNNIYLDKYLSLQRRDNYVGVSKYIGVTEINSLSKLKKNAYVRGIKNKVKQYGSLLLDMDIEVYSRNLNIFNSCIVDFLKFDNLTVLVHTKDMYRRLTLYKNLNNYNYELYLVKKEVVNKKVDITTLDGVVIDEYGVTLHLIKRLSKITSTHTISSLIKELENCEYSGTITIDIDGVFIWDYSKFYNMFIDVFGERLFIKSNNKTTLDEFNLAKAYNTKNNTTSVNLLKKVLLGVELDTVMLLYTYTLGRRDVYKRRGNGDIESIKIAIFKGVDNSGKLILDTYSREDLESKLVNNRTETISIKNIGYRDLFLGTLHHLELPILESLDDVGLFKIDGLQVVCAEYIEYLLDMNGIYYNKQALHSCVELSYDKLQSLYDNLHK